MKTIYFLFALLLPLLAEAQFVPKQADDESSAVDFGLGIGLDYGGFGGRLTYFPEKHIGLFGAVGYALAGAGYNIGAKYRFNPDDRARFIAGAMYGYNGVIQVTNASQYDKIYYGTSIFIGTEIRSRRNQKNYFSLELIAPFRPQAFTDDINSLKKNPNVTKITEPLPIALSLGYHFGL